MKTPHQKLIALLIAFVFFACAGVKKTEKIAVKESVKAQTELSKKVDKVQNLKVISQTEVANNKSIEEIEKLSENLETRLITYDTDKPVDVSTGKPPVKSERITTYVKSSQKDNKITDKSIDKINLKIDAKTVLKSKVDSNSNTNNKVVSKTETTEKPVNEPLKWILIVLFLSGIGGLIWLLKKFK